MERRDIRTWTALISAYTHGNCIEKAIDVLILMTENNIRPNQVTMVSLVSFCTESGTLDLGKWIHTFIDKQGIEIDIVLFPSFPLISLSKPSKFYSESGCSEH